jgi:hypothetical protein
MSFNSETGFDPRKYTCPKGGLVVNGTNIVIVLDR